MLRIKDTFKRDEEKFLLIGRTPQLALYCVTHKVDALVNRYERMKCFMIFWVHTSYDVTAIQGGEERLDWLNARVMTNLTDALAYINQHTPETTYYDGE